MKKRRRSDIDLLAPPLMLPLFLWPLSLFFLDAIRLCWAERDGPRLFLLSWIVPGWLMFEVLPGKQWAPCVAPVAIAGLAVCLRGHVVDES